VNFSLICLEIIRGKYNATLKVSISTNISRARNAYRKNVARDAASLAFPPRVLGTISVERDDSDSFHRPAALPSLITLCVSRDSPRDDRQTRRGLFVAIFMLIHRWMRLVALHVIRKDSSPPFPPPFPNYGRGTLVGYDEAGFTLRPRHKGAFVAWPGSTMSR